MPKRVPQLSDKQIKDAKIPPVKQYSLWDGGGLFLLITPAGGKLWRLKYRFLREEKRLALGAYPEVSLKDAREKRDEARKLLAKGIDPAEHKKNLHAAALSAAANTFEILSRQWHNEKKLDWSSEHASACLKRLENYVFPFIGNKPVNTIKTTEIIALLKSARIRSPEIARKIKSYIYNILNNARIHEIIEHNPAADINQIFKEIDAKNKTKTKHMAAPITAKEAAPILIAIDSYKGHMGSTPFSRTV